MDFLKHTLGSTLLKALKKLIQFVARGSPFEFRFTPIFMDLLKRTLYHQSFERTDPSFANGLLD